MVDRIPLLRAIGYLEWSSVGTIAWIAEGDGHEADDSPYDIGLDNSLSVSHAGEWCEVMKKDWKGWL